MDCHVHFLSHPHFGEYRATTKEFLPCKKCCEVRKQHHLVKGIKVVPQLPVPLVAALPGRGHAYSDSHDHRSHRLCCLVACWLCGRPVGKDRPGGAAGQGGRPGGPSTGGESLGPRRYSPGPDPDSLTASHVTKSSVVHSYIFCRSTEIGVYAQGPLLMQTEHLTTQSVLRCTSVLGTSS